MTKRVANFVLMTEPEWLDTDYLLSYLPSEEPIGLASMRSLVLLAPSEVAEELCPPQKVCVPLSAGEALSNVLKRVIDDILEVLLGEYEHSSPSRFKEVIEGAINSVDKAVRDVGPAECVGIKCLGCFISEVSTAALAKYGLVLRGPVIVVDLDEVSEVCDDAVEDLGVSDDSNYMKRYLLSSVITHEVVHAFTDLCSKYSPKYRMESLATKFYYRMIEESLATYYEVTEVLERRSTLPYKYLVAKLLSKSTLEYRAGLTWKLYLGGKGMAGEVLKAWAGFTPPTKALEPLLNITLGAPPRLELYLERLIRRALQNLTITHPHLVFHAVEHALYGLVRRLIDPLIGSLRARPSLLSKLESLLWRLLAVKLAVTTSSKNLAVDL